ncbi:MAG TPA: class I SAM-dependent methyltransferase [Solirubrobacteraceae bacterium]|nr:class I SAM-dependent methyltransferase [Solirubrobacteraceae bacterium]
MADLAERARTQPWYHTLELPGHTTSGIFDLRPYVERYGLPESLAGRRVLEIGTWDGFWAFEMERRGAEVVAIDLDDERELDWPPRRREAKPQVRRGAGFELARELLGSKVERVVRSIYDTRPEDVGTFDLVFCGSVLLHLRDQLLALERIAELTRPGGLFISAEEYDRTGDLLPWPAARFLGNRDEGVVFWLPSRRAWRQMLWYAGFDGIEEHSRFTMRSTQGWSIRHVVHHARRSTTVAA